MCRRVASLVLPALLVLAGTTRAAAEPTALPAPLAYDYGETETPRSLGIGALHAAGGGVNALFLNPANFGITRAYHVGALAQFLPEAGRHLYGGAIMDSTRRFSGGLGFVGGFQDPDGADRTTLDARAGLAYAISPELHLGLGARYLRVHQEGLGVLGASRASGGLLDPEAPPSGRELLLEAVTADAGVTFRPIPELYIGAFGQNLTHPGIGLVPTLAGGGVAFGTEDFTLEVDGLADFDSWGKTSARVMAGGEYLLLDRVPLRAGYRLDLLDGASAEPSHSVSGGLGYVTPQLAVEASVRRSVTGPSMTVIAVAFTYHIESLGLQIEPY